jgi:hypothetical protein
MKSLGFQALHPEGKAVMLPIKQFDCGSFAIAKPEKMAGEGIHLQLMLNQDGKTIDGLPQICCSWGQIDV